jgi:hypothetical protein
MEGIWLFLWSDALPDNQADLRLTPMFFGWADRAETV